MALKRVVYPKLVWCMAVWGLFLGTAPGRAFALPSESVGAFQSGETRAAHIEKIMQVMSRPEAQIHLRAHGLTSGKLQTQLARLNDSQLAEVSQKAESIQSAGVLGIIIALLVIAILVVILMWLVDADDKVVVVDKD